MAKKTKIPHFDDGGDVDTDMYNYFNADEGGGNQGETPISADTGLTPGALSSDQLISPSMTNSQAASAATGDGNGNISLNYQGDQPGAASKAGSAAAGTAANGAVSALLKSLGIGASSPNANALLGLLSAAGLAKANSTAGKLPTLPTLPGSTSTGYGPTGGYGYSNYAGAGAGTPGTGYAPVQQVAPKPAASYYTYGQGPQQQQFQQVNGGAPITPVTQMAKGGHVAKFAMGGPMGAPGQPFTPPAQNPVPTPQPMPQPQAPAAMPQRPPVQPIPPMQQRPAPAPNPQSFMAQRMAQARGPTPQSPVPTPTPPQMPVRPAPGMPPHMATGGFVNQQTNPTPGPAIGMAQSQVMGSQPSHGIQIQHRGPAAAGRTPGMATGGALSQPGVEGPGVSRHITGPGDGTSDSIPARLANGEYVFDAQAVSMLGNGDNSAGAKVLDKFRENLRKHKGGALSKGKMAPDAKDPNKYMGSK